MVQFCGFFILLIYFFRYRAIVRTVQDKKESKDKQWIEIWTDETKIQTVNIDAADRHGKIYDDDGSFGCLEWNNAETHLLYIAESKKPKSVSYFDQKGSSLSDELLSSPVIRGDEYVYRDNWGEQMSEKSQPVLCVLDIETGIIRYLISV